MSLEGVQLGNYKLLNRIGDGGMGEVYVAEDVRIARQVAIKVVKAELAPYPDEDAIKAAQRLFQREMRAIANLNNTHILPMYDFGTQTLNKSELTYMVMPYHAEGSLADWLQQRGTSGPLSLPDIAHIIDQAAEALQYAHDNGLVHQDIKPQNFLVRSRKEAPSRPDLFLADFGIAKFSSATSQASQSVRGTPGYMPPEQWGSSPVPATDQYALAMMAYELLTRRLPFQGRMEQVMYQHLQVQPPAPSTFNSRISPAIDAVILRALAKKPEERFPSVSAFAHAFQQAILYADLRATLRITNQDATTGSNRTMRLPGKRQVTVTVPTNTKDGQVIRMANEGEPYYENGPRGPLVLSIAIDDSVQPTGPMTPIPDMSHQEPPAKEQQTPPLEPTIPVYPPDYQKVALEQTVAETTPPIRDFVIPPPPAPPSAKKSSTTRNIVLAVVALILVISGIIGFASYQNHIYQQNTAATASADDATNQANNDANATATAIAFINNNPYPNYLPGKGTIAFVDPLTGPSHWHEGADTSFGGSCKYSGGVLHVAQSISARFYECDSDISNFSNFAIEVQMTIISGDCGGITFRNNLSNGQLYKFRVCQDQNSDFFHLEKYTGYNGSDSSILTSGSISLNQTNTLAIFANGSTLDVYLNQSQIGSIDNDSYTTGNIGFTAEDSSNATEVTYSNAKIWTVS